VILKVIFLTEQASRFIVMERFLRGSLVMGNNMGKGC